ncbi:MAG: hypothetical protein H6818_21420 [Phycisphaerales bacterium]|nr:hypothetical protein [Phycisphaerales bacterium]MCB9862351.1 hypothetical protein [Phycisphaerales bacterium]
MAAETPIDTEQNKTGDSVASAPPDQVDSAKPSPLSGVWGIVVAMVLLATAVYLAYQTMYTVEPTPLDPPPIMYICSETLETFQHKPEVGESIPIDSPFSKKKTGYPAEKCYWTKDGKQKLIPTYVLMNENLGIKKPTICPDCGRLVVPHNPLPPKGTPFATNEDDVIAGRKPAASQPATEN